MNDILTVRDHSQPCEHPPNTRDSLGRGLYSVTGLWWCEFPECPGGREIKLRRPDWFGDRPGGNATEPLSVWVETTR